MCMRGAGVGEAQLYLLPAPATCYLPPATHNSPPLYRAPDEAQLSTGRRRTLKATPGWRKASSAAPTRTRTRPDPSPNPIPGEFGGECFCGRPRRGVLLPFTPTPTPTPQHPYTHRPRTLTLTRPSRSPPDPSPPHPTPYPTLHSSSSPWRAGELQQPGCAGGGHCGRGERGRRGGRLGPAIRLRA